METVSTYSAEELAQIQRIEYNLLNIISGICDKNGIEYFLIGGTALGAVRHSGFIPWDDDIDIGMTRNNYRKFLSIVPNRLPDGYVLQSPYQNKVSPYFYTKIRIDGTVFMEYCNRGLPIHQGVYIDVFPFDNVPDDEQLNIKHFQKVQNLIRLFTLRQIPDVSSKPNSLIEHFKAFFRFVLHLICKCIPHKLLLKEIEATITMYNAANTAAVACLNFPKRKTEYILKSDLYPLIKMKFVDKEFFIPGNYDQYLRTHYGDYLKLPPPEMRYGHKPFHIKLTDKF